MMHQDISADLDTAPAAGHSVRQEDLFVSKCEQ
jgi:hypothetical protein